MKNRAEMEVAGERGKSAENCFPQMAMEMRARTAQDEKRRRKYWNKKRMQMLSQVSRPGKY